jgi:hypothetical protein
MNTKHVNRGQALIIVALALAGLAGIVGLVVDGGNAFMDRRNAQSAADSAALAAAFTRIRGGPDIASTALKSAAQNGYDNNGVSNVVEVYSPPKNGPHSGQVEYIEVTITSHVTTYFARIIGRNTITNVVTAIARTKTPEITQVMNGAAVISLAPTSDCNNQKAFWIHGEATLDIKGGGVFVNSSNETCALVQNGNGSIKLSNGFTVSVVGGASIQKPTLISPGVRVGTTPVSYPPPFFIPDFGCSEAAEVNIDGTSMSPGNWDDDFPPEGVSQLDPGIYCLNNGLNIMQDLKGNNVVFKVNKGEVRFDNNSRIELNAPNTGELSGLLIFLPLDNNDNVILNGGSGSSIQGTILAPASPILFKGMNFQDGFHSQIIGYTIEADGPNKIQIIYVDTENLNSMTMPEVQLAE